MWNPSRFGMKFCLAASWMPDADLRVQKEKHRGHSEAQSWKWISKQWN